MKTLVLTAAAALLAVTGMTGTAEARCYRVGHHWSCTHHRHHYAHRWHHRSWARYGYGSPYYSYGYGGGYSSYDPYRWGGAGPRPYSWDRY